MHQIPHPIPYQGSKRNLAPQILSYFPGDAHRLVEPFAGSAALSLAAVGNRRVEQVVLNDINAALMALWSHLLQSPEQLAEQYTYLWHAQLERERRFYDLVRLRFNRTHRPAYFLYLLARCVKASVRYNAQGEFNQSPDNRRKGRHPDTMRKDILQAAALLKPAVQHMSSLNYRRVLLDVKVEDIVYLDPPYQGVSAKRDPRYAVQVQSSSFLEALSDLNQRNISYILSYDGRTGQKHHGVTLPTKLRLKRIELDAGRSSQATLLGRNERTIESLYLSPALTKRLSACQPAKPVQLPLFAEPA